jgi:phenylalanyl-tRNA synthetase beta chain
MLAWDVAPDDAEGRLHRALVADVVRLLERAGAAGVSPVDATGAAVAPGLPTPQWLHPGRSAEFRAGGRTLAVGGELAPAAVRAFGLAGRVAWAEVSLEALLAAVGAAPSEYRPVPRFPAVTFDVAVVVPRRTPAADVAAVVRGARAEILADVTLFDVYEGPAIPAGTRSLAFTCVLQDERETISAERADALRTAIRTALEARGWTVRAAAT